MHGIGTPEDLEKYKKYKEIDELSLITRDQCPITYSKNIEIINSRQFPLFCGCIEQDQKKILFVKNNLQFVGIVVFYF